MRKYRADQRSRLLVDDVVEWLSVGRCVGYSGTPKSLYTPKCQGIFCPSRSMSAKCFWPVTEPSDQ